VKPKRLLSKGACCSLVSTRADSSKTAAGCSDSFQSRSSEARCAFLAFLLLLSALAIPAAAQPTAPTAKTSASAKVATATTSVSAQPSAPLSASAPQVATEETPAPPQPKPTAATKASAQPSVAPPIVVIVPAPTPLPTASAAPTPPPLPEVEAPAEVRVGEFVAFTLRTRVAEQHARDRAALANKALKDSFDNATPDDARVERSGDVFVVYVGSQPIVQLTQADATAAGDPSLDVHADAVLAQLRKAIKAEKERTALANRILAISLVVVFGMVVIYLLRRIGDWAERGNHWVEDNPHRIPAIRVRTLTLLTPAAFRSAVALAISIARWVSQFAIVYVWLLAALGLFETTRGYTDKLNGYIVGPFVSLTSRIASMLPITVVVLIAGLVTAIVLRVIGLFFESVKSGATTIDWLPPDLAQPTSTLTRIGLVLTSLVFAAPVLTGHPDGALARGGLVGLATLGLASVPLIACATVGALVVYGRRYRVGDYLRIGPTSGRVAEVGLLDVVVEDDEGLLTRVPHLLSLVRPVQLQGTSPRVTIRVAVERRRATSALRAELSRTIVAVGAEPRVEVEEVGRDTVAMALSVLSEDLDARSRLHLLVLEVLDNPPSAAPATPNEGTNEALEVASAATPADAKSNESPTP